MKRTYRCFVQIRDGVVLEDPDDGTPFLYATEKEACEAKTRAGFKVGAKVARATVLIRSNRRRKT